MNILFVHEVDWLNKVVFDIHSLADGLSLRGHHVFAIDYEDTWKQKNLFDLGSLKTSQFDGIARSLPGASVTLIRPGFIKIPALSRLSAAFTHYKEIHKTIREKNIEVIILYSVPTNGLQTVSLARKFKIPVIFRSIDILNMMVRYPALRRITKFLEKKVYSSVDLVLPNTPQYLKYVSGMGVPESRIRLLPFPVDTSLFRPSVDSSEVRRKWDLEGEEQIIVFIGTLFEFSGLDEFLCRFPGVLKEVPQARLLIVGDGPQRSKLERIIAEMGLKNRVIITGFQPYRTMPEYINLAAVCINTFRVTGAIMDTFPSKIVQYAACGKATVATPLRGITSLLPGESHGVVYAADAAGIVGEVISLLKSAERRQQIGQNGLNYVRDNFNYEKISGELETILEEAIREKHHETTSRRN
ncbi:MAG: glycosyltransferase family 4 protein [Dehalococcoidales bacterium]